MKAGGQAGRGTSQQTTTPPLLQPTGGNICVSEVHVKSSQLKQGWFFASYSCKQRGLRFSLSLLSPSCHSFSPPCHSSLPPPCPLFSRLPHFTSHTLRKIHPELPVTLNTMHQCFKLKTPSTWSFLSIRHRSLRTQGPATSTHGQNKMFCLQYMIDSCCIFDHEQVF